MWVVHIYMYAFIYNSFLNSEENSKSKEFIWKFLSYENMQGNPLPWITLISSLSVFSLQETMKANCKCLSSLLWNLCTNGIKDLSFSIWPSSFLCPADNSDHITETFKGKLIFNLSYGAVCRVFISEVSCCFKQFFLVLFCIWLLRSKHLLSIYITRLLYNGLRV